jgi:hypothetical protein
MAASFDSIVEEVYLEAHHREADHVARQAAADAHHSSCRSRSRSDQD